MEREIIDNLFLYLKNKTMIYVSHKDIRDKFEKVITVGVNND